MGNATNLIPANERRRAGAADRVIPTLTELFRVHGPALPKHLAMVGQARLDHPEETLAELGARFDPPLSKHAVAGRLRQLLKLPI